MFWSVLKCDVFILFPPFPVISIRQPVSDSDAIMEGGHYVTIHGQNITHNPLAAPAMSIERLFPALLECFGIILCGYAAGRSELISTGQTRSLGSFVSCFALPALLFRNMVQLQFGNVVWSFLWSVLIAKVCVFALVCVLTLLVASPEGRFGKAGLFAIFATQSNDFALGYPIGEQTSISQSHTLSFNPSKAITSF